MYRAETRILARNIYTGGALTEFLEKECEASNLNFDLAYAEALARGLYRFLGEQYQAALTFTIQQAAEDIIGGLIENKADLRFYFESAARNSISHMPREKAIRDLTIDARQAGLFDLLESLSGAIWPCVPPVVAQVA
jgi:hypothetical protein